MITPSFSLTATERVLPKLALDFTTASLDSRITFTRTTDATHPATYINSSGVLTLATNNQPRFDYDPATLICKGLLIEESRTNLIQYSSIFDNAAWAKQSTGTYTASLTANAGVSPDGTQNAYLFTGNSGADGSTGSVNIRQNPAVTAGSAYTASVYFKAYSSADVGKKMSLLSDNGAGLQRTVVTLTNSWQRISATNSSISGASDKKCIISYESSFNTTANNDVVNALIYGAQFEQGAFPTSYIPTSGASLTRNADVATMTGTNFSDWYNQSEGAFVLQAARYVGTGGSMTHFSVSDGTNLDWYRVYSSGADGLEYFTGLDNGATQWDRSRSSVTSDTTFKLCAAYKLNNIAFALNGGTVTTDSVATIPTVDRLLFGQTGNGTASQGRQYIQKLFYYPQVFTGSETTAFSK